ncbi:MAG: GerMN domain-containing protein [Pseudomonadota bacterium]
MPIIIAGLLAAAGCSQPVTSDRDPPGGQFHVYFNNDSLTEGHTVCDAVFPVLRSSPEPIDEPSAALEALFPGPTPEERAQGYRSFFSARTAGLLKHLKIESGTAYLDLRDKRTELAGITSSCGSAEFFSQIQHTLGEYPEIQRIIFAIEGNPGVFYDWLELECDQSNDDCDPAPFALPSD